MYTYLHGPSPKRVGLCLATEIKSNLAPAQTLIVRVGRRRVSSLFGFRVIVDFTALLVVCEVLQSVQISSSRVGAGEGDAG